MTHVWEETSTMGLDGFNRVWGKKNLETGQFEDVYVGMSTEDYMGMSVPKFGMVMYLPGDLFVQMDLPFVFEQSMLYLDERSLNKALEFCQRMADSVLIFENGVMK